jgi:hypothetical protein
MTLVRVAGSYAEVTMPDGRRAYIAADSLITIGTTPRK